MKPRSIVIVFICVIFITTTAFVLKVSTGKAGFAGNPGSPNCSHCHFNGTGETVTTITSSPSFIGNQYMPNQTYTINVTVSSTTLNHFGFDCVVLNDTLGGAVNAGTVFGISPESQILNTGIRDEAVQVNTAAGIGSPSTKTFVFLWTAPSSGLVAFYASGLAVDNNGTYGNGDLVDTAALILTGASSTGIRAINEVSSDLKIFPNPSIDQITLEYGLLIGGKTKASIYNLQGKELGILFNEQQMIGKYTKTVFLPNSISSGFYIIKLSVNEKQIAEKIIFKK